MAFVLHKFTDADKAKYDNLQLKRPTHAFPYPLNWVLDEEHDALMVSFGGSGELPPERGEPPNFYCLVWGGQVIEIEGHHSTVYSDTGAGGVVLHKLTRMVAAKSLEDKVEMAKVMIEDALLAFESRSRYPADAVNVEFSNTLYA